MTPRVVIFSTVHSIHGGKHHAESIIPGVPICGAPLRNWTRAVAVDDRGLCASCWPASSVDKSVNESTPVKAVIHRAQAIAHTPCGAVSIQVSDDIGTIETTPEGAPTPLRGLTRSTPAPAKTRGV